MQRSSLNSVVEQRPWLRGLALAAFMVAAAGLAPGSSRRFEAPPVPLRAQMAEDSIRQDDLRRTVTYLASDDLAGRGVGQAGNDQAVRFVVDRLATDGLAPAGSNGYRQTVPLVLSSMGRDTRLTAGAESRASSRAWSAGDEFLPIAGSPNCDITAPVVYVGLGVVDAAHGVDDYRGMDVSGRIVVALDQSRRTSGKKTRARSTSAENRGAGRSVPVAPRPDAFERVDSLEAKARDASQRGAVALVLVSRDRHVPGFTTMWPDTPALPRAPLRSADASLPLPVARVGSEVGSELLDLARSASSASSVKDLFEKPQAHIDTHARAARLVMSSTERSVNASNVLGMIRGRDATGAEEVVVLGAHIDHDGIDAEGTIYNGADDDSSGAAAVLAVARAFARAARDGWSPRRSVLFALWNAEEQGLLGSGYFVTHPMADLGRAVADLNLDMVGRHEEIPPGGGPRFGGLPPVSESNTRNLVHVLGYSLSPDLASLVKEEAATLSLSIGADYDAHPVNLLRRSDHWSFLRAGVPALFVTTGLHPDYHTPRDDADRIDYDKLVRVTRLAFRVVWRLADAQSSPTLTGLPTPEP